LAIFMTGHSTHALKMLKGFLYNKGFGSFLCDLLYYILPNLSNFNIKNDIIHNVPIGFQVYSTAMLYAVLYSGLVFLLSIYSFSKRNFY
jgi:hypothetical protein